MTLSPPTVVLLNTVGLTSRRVAELEGCGIREAARLLHEAGAVGGHRGIWRTALTRRGKQEEPAVSAGDYGFTDFSERKWDHRTTPRQDRNV